MGGVTCSKHLAPMGVEFVEAAPDGDGMDTAALVVRAANGKTYRVPEYAYGSLTAQQVTKLRAGQRITVFATPDGVPYDVEAYRTPTGRLANDANQRCESNKARFTVQEICSILSCLLPCAAICVCGFGAFLFSWAAAMLLCMCMCLFLGTPIENVFARFVYDEEWGDRTQKVMSDPLFK